MDDETIKRHIVEKLFWDNQVAAENIDVQVDHGIVRLTGGVPTYYAKWAVEKGIMTIPGVISVKNYMTVGYGYIDPIY